MSVWSWPISQDNLRFVLRDEFREKVDGRGMRDGREMPICRNGGCTVLPICEENRRTLDEYRRLCQYLDFDWTESDVRHVAM